MPGRTPPQEPETAPLNAAQPRTDEGATSPGNEEAVAPGPSSMPGRALAASFASAVRRAFSRLPSASAERLGSSDGAEPSGDAAAAAAVPVQDNGHLDLERGQPSSSGQASTSRQNSGGSPRGGSRPSGSGAHSQPVCLICLEVLTSEDFRSGKAISLDCKCRGELALRHQECAVQWARVKGDLVCELCKQPVRNLPALPPAPPPGDALEVTSLEDLYGHEGHPHMVELTPNHTDLVFDMFRVTWVAMIVSVLFFEMDLGAALWTGLLAGLAYSFMVRLMYRQHFAAMQRMATEQHLARQQQMHGMPAHVIPVITVV